MCSRGPSVRTRAASASSCAEEMRSDGIRVAVGARRAGGVHGGPGSCSYPDPATSALDPDPRRGDHRRRSPPCRSPAAASSRAPPASRAPPSPPPPCRPRPRSRARRPDDQGRAVAADARCPTRRCARRTTSRIADEVVRRLDRTWVEDERAYSAGGRVIDVIYNAALLTIHAVAAERGYDGPSRNDDAGAADRGAAVRVAAVLRRHARCPTRTRCSTRRAGSADLGTLRQPDGQGDRPEGRRGPDRRVAGARRARPRPRARGPDRRRRRLRRARAGSSATRTCG